MLISTSAEFITLCQSQVALLTQGLGASLSVVYLTEELLDTDAKLIPIVVYPETTKGWDREQTWEITRPGSAKRVDQPTNLPRLLSAGVTKDLSRTDTNLIRQSSNYEVLSELNQENQKNTLRPQYQLVLPMIHEGVMMGLLVTGREDRAWNEGERPQVELIAHTLAIACLLDRRAQWSFAQLNEQQLLQEQQQNLLSNLLHQFRNPLTALKTFGKLLLKRLSPPDPNRDIAQSIVRESDRLNELLQDLDRSIDLEQVELTLTPVQPNQEIQADADIVISAKNNLSLPMLPAENLLLGRNLPRTICDLAKILAPLLVSAQAIASERQLNLEAEISPNLPPVLGNDKALCEVFTNLIDNALKYTPQGGYIYIRAMPMNCSWENQLQPIAISDTGPGIPPQDREHLFERHYRGVQAQTNIPGTGLGLAIAKDLVEQMQGKIDIYSPVIPEWLPDYDPDSTIINPGRGTTFVLWLPIAISEAAR